MDQDNQKIENSSADQQPGPATEAEPAPTELLGRGNAAHTHQTIEDQIADLQARVKTLEEGKQHDVEQLRLEFERYKGQLHDAGVRLVS